VRSGREPDRKRTFQRVLFPSGVEFNGSTFGTAPSGPVFSYLRDLGGGETKMVAQTIPTWNQLEVWFREINELKHALAI
jgi:hypothetical protein